MRGSFVTGTVRLRCSQVFAPPGWNKNVKQGPRHLLEVRFLDMPVEGNQGSIDPWRTCERLAKRHYENFTVGSRLLPRRLRYPMWSVYAYCRTVDDLGDEADGDRSALLDLWERELRLCYTGTPKHPVMRALQQSIQQFNLPLDPLLRLIEANRRDQRIKEYQTFADLAEYCEYSANPVGHLVLALLGCDSPQTRSLSNATCTALQLTNFWQDVDRDLDKGRIYIPREDMAQFGYTPDELRARTYNESFRRLMTFEVQRTRAMFAAGEGLLHHIPGRFKIDISLFRMGGQTILDQLAGENYNVFQHRPSVSKWHKGRLFLKAVRQSMPWGRRP